MSAIRARSGSALKLRGAIERLARSQGRFTIAAAAATEEAQESRELGHGVLSYSLLACFKAVDRGPLVGKPIAPSTPDGVIGIMQWFTYAAEEVPRLTEKIYGTPQDVQFRNDGANFPLLPLDE